MRAQRRLELRVGLFISAAIGLALVAIWMLGSAQNMFMRRDEFYITIPDASGISPGAKVTISGVNAGMVRSFELNHADRTVRVDLSISNRFESAIRADSFAEIITEGVLGDKLVAIAAGSPNSRKLPVGSEIAAHPEPSLQTLLGKGNHLASSLATLSKDLDRLVLEIHRQFQGDHLGSSLGKLDHILGKVDEGNGTIGGLLNDPMLYDDVKSLIGESNENRIVRNLVRKSVKDGSEKENG